MGSNLSKRASQMYRCSSSRYKKLLRAVSTASSPQHRTNLIFGANTGVGKTLVSAGLVRAALSHSKSLADGIGDTAQSSRVVHYIKPLQCGGSDANFIQNYAEKIHDDTASFLKTSTLYRWETPSSPHTASLKENKPWSDDQLLDSLRSALQIEAFVSYIETAGGVLSPSSASPLNKRRGPLSHALDTDKDGVEWGWSTQADLYQELIGVSSVVLVGDGRLGGISCTLSALESLLLRGFDVAALILIRSHDSNHQNMSAIRSYLRSKQLRTGSGELLFSLPYKSLLTLPPIPDDPLLPLDEWFKSTEVSDTFFELDLFLHQSWQGEIDDHKAAVGSSIGSNNVEASKGSWTSIRKSESLFRVLDVSNGRWEHGDCTLGLSMASALGRYGNHSNEKTTTAPKEALAQLFRNRKLIFADMEAAIRMGIKTYQQRMNVSEKQSQSINWIVVGQEDCYHGHSLASLCIAELYFDRDHPWYQSKALLMVPPTFGYQTGHLVIDFPTGMDVPPDVSREFDSIESILDVRARTMTKLFSLYKEMIEMQWLVHEHSSHRKIACVVLEPLLLATGTIKWVDPLWQRAMIAIAETRNIPIVLDESMTGLFRLGYKTMETLLGVSADISVFSNRSCLLPTNTNFCVATHEVFNFCNDDSFLAESSFEASPAECNAAFHILTVQKQHCSPERVKDTLFTDRHARDLSRLKGVRSAVAMGTLFTVTLQCPNDNGDEEWATRIASAVKTEGGVLVKQCGASLLAEVGPWTNSGVCDLVVNHVQCSIETQAQKKSCFDQNLF